MFQDYPRFVPHMWHLGILQMWTLCLEARGASGDRRQDPGRFKKQVKACKALQQLRREMGVGRGAERWWLGGGQEMLTQVGGFEKMRKSCQADK